MDMVVLSVSKPYSLVSFGFIKERIASLSTIEVCLPFIWASKHMKLGLDLKPLVLATKPTSIIPSMAKIEFG